jgi:phosphotransferase system enzyme I (PtsI)
MNIFKGRCVFSGIAFGKAVPIIKRDFSPDESLGEDPEAEWRAFEEAKLKADAELEDLFEKTREEIGEEEAQIVDIQRMLLEDSDFTGFVENLIREEKRRASWAVNYTGNHFSGIFAALDDPYMKARAPDILDVSRRVVSILTGKKENLSLTEPSVVLADDLSPSQTLQLDKTLVRAFVTRRGSLSSHTAILARTLRIPALVLTDFPLDENLAGRDAAVDSKSGVFYLEPDRETRKLLEEKLSSERKEAALLDAVRGFPAATKSGKSIQLFANIGNVADAEIASAEDAEGIGLFRSEFLYLGRESLPGEDEQFEAYREVAEIMGRRRIIIRTLDIGADKKAPYLNLEDEENPALGLRGIRLCLEKPEIFKTQLRAIYRASAYGNISVMFPMISSVWEIRRCRELALEARLALESDGITVENVPLGVMIETPAAAILAGDLAKEAEFFSVGTNDLTQYVLAADRQNSKLEVYADPRHPALLTLLTHIARSAIDAGIEAGICGELASYPELTGRFIEMGFTELSVSPAYILPLRKHIREMD